MAAEEAFAADVNGPLAASRKSTRFVPGAATSTLAVELMKPILAAATWYSPGSSLAIVKVPLELLIAVRSVPLLTLCAVIRTSATGYILAESRVTPLRSPNKSCPIAGMGNVANCKAMQAGTTAEKTELRVINVLSEIKVTVVCS
jgi:hypothetical protein